MIWADYIYETLKARIVSGEALPVRLTLRGLSAEYKVSPTPVRSAVKRLLEEELLRKERGWLTVNQDTQHAGGKASLAAYPVPPKDHFKTVFRDMIPLTLRGKGVYLREEAWAKRYGISRAAIRQIFARLVGVGILEHHPRRGWHLRPFCLEDMNDFLEVREALELKALDLAKSNLITSDLKGFLDRNILPTGEERPIRDNSFHTYIIRRAGNRYISSFFKRYGQYYELLFEWEACDRESEILACGQHRRILQALMARKRRSNGQGTLFKRTEGGPWLASWFDHTDKRKERSTRTTDRKAAERILAKRVADTALRRDGVIDARKDRFGEENRKPLAEHVADYMAHCRHVGHAKKHIAEKQRHLDRIVASTGATRLSDLTADMLENHLRNMKNDDLSARMVNFARQIAVAFLSWCKQTGRVEANPLTVVAKLDERKDRRWVRRPLTDDELARLLEVAEARGRKAWYLARPWRDYGKATYNG